MMESNMAGEAAIPRELLRELLRDDASLGALHSELLCQGNCLAATAQGHQVLAFHPSGPCGELLTMSVLLQGLDDSEPWQVSTAQPSKLA